MLLFCFSPNYFHPETLFFHENRLLHFVAAPHICLQIQLLLTEEMQCKCNSFSASATLIQDHSTERPTRHPVPLPQYYLNHTISNSSSELVLLCFLLFHLFFCFYLLFLLFCILKWRKRKKVTEANWALCKQD